jgi:type I site-specific restriction endonuclease
MWASREGHRQVVEVLVVAPGIDLRGALTTTSEEDAHTALTLASMKGYADIVRSLVGLDREAAKRALGKFTAGGNLTANQIEFVNLIVDQLTERGVMAPELLYESPFTDLNPQGPEGVFAPAQVDDLIGLLDEIRKTAVA